MPKSIYENGEYCGKQTLGKVPNSSNSSEEGGNTKTPSFKQISPSIRWTLTLNNYTEDEIIYTSSICSKYCKYAVIEKEIGENGTPHLQGYIEFKTKSRPCSVFNKIDRYHFEKAKESREINDTYCSKDKNVIISIGRPKPIKIITNLYEWQENIIKMMETEPDDRKVFWFWDEVGNIGKTQFIKYCIVKHKILYCNGGKMSDIMNLVFNQDMNETSCVMFNIPRANEGHVSYSALESIKDGLVCNTKYETGVKVFNSPHLFVFANFPPSDETKLSRDRWVITNLGGTMKDKNELESDEEWG